MFKAVRISILLFILLFVALSTFLTQARSTDWNNSLWIKVYPINADGSTEAEKYIQGSVNVRRPVRIELGSEIDEQPPELDKQPNTPSVMLWSMKMRWWAGSVTDDQDRIDPDVRIFVRYHRPDLAVVLENSVGLQKGMVGIVNGYANRRYRGTNNVIIAHEFLHTLGATDKFSAAICRDYGGAYCYSGGRFGHTQEPEVRRHRHADGQRDKSV